MLAPYAILAAIVVVVFTGCASFDAPDPAARKGTEDYPCGPAGQVCAAYTDWRQDTCCAQGDICPDQGPGSCMSGYCCFGGSFDPSPRYGADRIDGGTSAHRVRSPLRKAVP